MIFIFIFVKNVIKFYIYTLFSSMEKFFVNWYKKAEI